MRWIIDNMLCRAHASREPAADAADAADAAAQRYAPGVRQLLQVTPGLEHLHGEADLQQVQIACSMEASMPSYSSPVECIAGDPMHRQHPTAQCLDPGLLLTRDEVLAQLLDHLHDCTAAIGQHVWDTCTP